MAKVHLEAAARSHLFHVVRHLCASGWRIVNSPDGARLPRNGQRIELRTANQTIRFRLFVYKVTGSSRGKPHERRIEITSTYGNRIEPVREFPDYVLGYDGESEIFVGVDPERIRHGGPTGNASSFFDREGLSWDRDDTIQVRQRHAVLFPTGVEHHAFLRPPRLAEYFFNHDDIHNGAYLGRGLFSGPAAYDRRAHITVEQENAGGDLLVLEHARSPRRRPLVRDALVRAAERGDYGQLQRERLTPEEFNELQRQMVENGRLGEEFVINFERRRLASGGHPELAARVRWMSQESVCEGYDVLSFEIDGTPRHIEVKATIGDSNSFDMSANEWDTCCRVGNSYYIYRVTRIRSTHPVIRIVRNPFQLERDGELEKTASGWHVQLL